MCPAQPAHLVPAAALTPTAASPPASTSPTTPAPPGPHDTPPFALVSAPSALVATLSALLQASVNRNDAQPAPPLHSMSVFHALEPPSISVPDYVARVAKYVFCSDACLVLAYDYMLRAIATHTSLALSSLSVHRLFITAVVLACKYLDDVSYNLAYYAKVGGLPTPELANLEMHMLRLLDFRLDASPVEFAALERTMISDLFALCAPQDGHGVVDLAVRARQALTAAGIVKNVPTSPLSRSVSPALSAEAAPARRPHRRCANMVADGGKTNEVYEARKGDAGRCAGYLPCHVDDAGAQSSPVSSECPTDSTMSRNSSMASVRDSECCEIEAVRAPHGVDGVDGLARRSGLVSVCTE